MRTGAEEGGVVVDLNISVMTKGSKLFWERGVDCKGDQEDQGSEYYNI